MERPSTPKLAFKLIQAIKNNKKVKLSDLAKKLGLSESEIYKSQELSDKDLENIKGDLANDYKTIPILYGELTSKKIITLLTILTVTPIFLLIEKFEIGNMDLYFYSCLLFLF